MAYNKTKDSSAGYISPMHQDLLQRIIEAHKRTKRGELEWLIEQAVINEWGYEHYRALIEAHQVDTQGNDMQSLDSETNNKQAEAS